METSGRHSRSPAQRSEVTSPVIRHPDIRYVLRCFNEKDTFASVVSSPQTQSTHGSNIRQIHMEEQPRKGLASHPETAEVVETTQGLRNNQKGVKEIRGIL